VCEAARSQVRLSQDAGIPVGAQDASIRVATGVFVRVYVCFCGVFALGLGRWQLECAGDAVEGCEKVAWGLRDGCHGCSV
jgi:hypothetical protein